MILFCNGNVQYMETCEQILNNWFKVLVHALKYLFLSNRILYKEIWF